ncbi:Uncharacterised protein [Candidatus Tiddalikarchaeum anstoanum]|nr:Uncharacterised protein [Candidatus Tiddalikarchaeum anstoanum]
MTQKLVNLKEEYYKYLDRKSRHLGYLLSKYKCVTKLFLKYITELYESENGPKRLYKNNKFESAYNNPISSDLEFLISRILYYYSKFKKLNWKIYLRRQVGKTAPDIRIEKNNKTIAIIEVKAKAGWIQCFFSKDRKKKDLIRFNEGRGNMHPDDFIKRIKSQFTKYYKEFKIKPNQVYVLLPTFTLVHRKKSKLNLKDYCNEFSKNSGLPSKNLIILSNNLLLNLDSKISQKEYQPTKILENVIKNLTNY